MASGMRPIPRSHHIGFRRAVIASVALHLAFAAFAVVIAWLPDESMQPGQPGVDTHIHEVSLRLDLDEPINIEPPHSFLPEPPTVTSQHVAPEATHPPTFMNVPNAISAEFLSIIHRSQSVSGPIGPAVNTNMKQASAPSTLSGSPLHGEMKPGQSVVYILDCSGSMGEFGKLTLAQAALIATLGRQPEGVRFQVILYNSTIRQLLPGGLLAVAANLRAVEARLARIEAVGRSNHLEALRAAVGLRSDAIVWLTDADDLSPAKLKPIIISAGKAIPVYVANVTASGVGELKELR
jgi:hypothetical protein